MFPSNPPTGIQRRPQRWKWGRAQSHQTEACSVPKPRRRVLGLAIRVLPQSQSTTSVSAVHETPERNSQFVIKSTATV